MLLMTCRLGQPALLPPRRRPWPPRTAPCRSASANPLDGEVEVGNVTGGTEQRSQSAEVRAVAPEAMSILSMRLTDGPSAAFSAASRLFLADRSGRMPERVKSLPLRRMDSGEIQRRQRHARRRHAHARCADVHLLFPTHPSPATRTAGGISSRPRSHPSPVNAGSNATRCATGCGALTRASPETRHRFPPPPVDGASHARTAPYDNSARKLMDCVRSAKSAARRLSGSLMPNRSMTKINVLPEAGGGHRRACKADSAGSLAAGGPTPRHTGDAVLPALDESAQREGDGLPGGSRNCRTHPRCPLLDADIVRRRHRRASDLPVAPTTMSVMASSVGRGFSGVDLWFVLTEITVA